MCDSGSRERLAWRGGSSDRRLRGTMTQRHIEHVYECNASVFWNQLFMDQEYNRRLFLDELGFESWQVLSSEEHGDEVRRVIEAVPRVKELPAALQKMVQNGLGYRETGVFNRSTQRYKCNVVPRSLASKLNIKGEMYAEPLGEKSFRRVFVGDVEAKVFGVGGLIERQVLDGLEKSYAKSAAFTNRWIAERSL
jgi:hypothetical protein